MGISNSMINQISQIKTCQIPGENFCCQKYQKSEKWKISGCRDLCRNKQIKVGFRGSFMDSTQYYTRDHTAVHSNLYSWVSIYSHVIVSSITCVKSKHWFKKPPKGNSIKVDLDKVIKHLSFSQRKPVRGKTSLNLLFLNKDSLLFISADFRPEYALFLWRIVTSNSVSLHFNHIDLKYRRKIISRFSNLYYSTIKSNQ